MTHHRRCHFCERTETPTRLMPFVGGKDLFVCDTCREQDEIDIAQEQDEADERVDDDIDTLEDCSD